jgi:hypothetical protein
MPGLCAPRGTSPPQGLRSLVKRMLLYCGPLSSGIKDRFKQLARLAGKNAARNFSVTPVRHILPELLVWMR